MNIKKKCKACDGDGESRDSHFAGQPCQECEGSGRTCCDQCLAYDGNDKGNDVLCLGDEGGVYPLSGECFCHLKAQ